MANGNFGGGDGSAVAPYLVEDALDLDAIRKSLTSFYRLTKNIDMSSFGNFTPIGESTTGLDFRGGLFGDGYFIDNLSIDASSNAGLFGYSTSLSLVNVRLRNANIKGSGSYTGGLVAYLNSNTASHMILGCSVTGQVEGAQTTGGIVGLATGNFDVVLQYCFFEGSVLSTDTSNSTSTGAGGIMGRGGDTSARKIMQDCYSSGTVSGPNVGGILGVSTYGSRVERCYSSSVISGSLCGAGIVGYGKGTSTAKHIINCYALNPRIIKLNPLVSNSLFGDICVNDSSFRVSECYALDTMQFVIGG